ncbi:MAG: YbaB/EbfC family nucleoid-associated protein [Peptostreptococcaceae bacterium]|nr:YbaB/EbfC family nucleoid-associated protein [Peptostreptococcaceae bacterium]
MAKNRMPGMPGDMNKMLKQAQKMQQGMQKKQDEIDVAEMEVTAGGGAVKIRINGKKEILEMIIAPDVVDPDDVEMLQDLIVAAVNEAVRTVEDYQQKELGKLTGGMNIPGF